MNSTNIKVISEEIQWLKDKLHAVDVEVPDPSQATDGQILSVDDGKYVITDPELPATSGASTGDVLGLVGENKAKGWITPYIPWDYSSTNEVNTGQKWVDGKDIYCKYFVCEETGFTGGNYTKVTNIPDIDNILWSCFTGDLSSTYKYTLTPNSVRYTISGSSAGDIELRFSASSGAITHLYGILLYTKAEPTRDDDTEPETKSTKKKTTKK